MFWFLRQSAPRLTQRLIGLVVLCGVCLAIVPLPQAPVVTAEKDRSKPFPCQDRPCGCRSAEQCWKSCCCFTNVEKVLWAKSHEVELPEFVLAAAAEETAKLAATAKCRSGSGCGGCRDAAPSCCHAKSARSPEVPAAETAVKSRAPAAAPPSRNGTKWVLGVAARGCRGEHGTISALPVSIPAPRSVLRCTAPVVVATFILASESEGGISRQPAVPPPRTGFSV